MIYTVIYQKIQVVLFGSVRQGEGSNGKGSGSEWGEMSDEE